MNLLLFLSILLCYKGAQVLCSNKFQTHATILRHFEYEGFHRELHSLVELVTAGQSALWGSCTLVLKETLPNGLYVNPDQLFDLRRVGSVQACTTSKIDVEAPASSSKPHTVYIYSKLFRTENLIYADVRLPLHVRYHQPLTEGGYVQVNLKAPALYIQCEEDLQLDSSDRVEAPCPICSEKTCSWLNVSYKTNSPVISLSIPVGNLNHLPIVTISTYLLTFGGCLYVLAAVVNKVLVSE